MLINIYIFLISIIIQIEATWLQVYSTFTNQLITNDGWIQTQQCDDANVISINIQTCATNQQQYIQLKDNKQQFRKEFSYKHFQVYIIFDFFYDQANDNDSWFKVKYQSGSTSKDFYSDKYKQDDLDHKSNRICTGGSDYNFRYYTDVSNSAKNNANNFNITFCSTPDSSSQKVGIRNLLVYINTCYPTCLTCDGEDFDQCTSCYDGVSTSSGKCTCNLDQQFSQTNIGCRQECDRDYFIAGSDKICVTDRRISSNLTYFNSNSLPTNTPFYLPFTYLENKDYQRQSQISYLICNSLSLVGKFMYNDALNLQLNFDSTVKFIRIRITFYFFQIQQNSYIILLLDDQIYSKFYKTSSGYSFDNFIKIYQYDENTNCNGSYTRIRVETILNIPNSNPKLRIQGTFKKNSESWGFNNFTLDQGYCKENCKVCKDFNTCQECLSGFILYQNECLSSCPLKYQSNCIEYDNINPYSRYVAKGFYDLNMTYDDIKSFYNSGGSSGGSSSGNFRSGQRFSFLSNKIVLGGMLVWTNYTYKKNWYIYQPHYAVTLRINLTFGDSYPGKFKYDIDSNSYGPISNPGGGQNILGRGNNEVTLYIEKYQNFNGFNLSLEFECNHTSSIDFRDSFCAISEYFLVVHNCQPLCLSCTSATICSSWKDGRNTCQDGKYLYYDTTSFNYTCESCTQPGCIKCTSVETCTQCKDDTQILQNDICQCLQNLFRFDDTCIQCDMQCLTCYGIGQNNCITCNKKHHRIYFESQCICEPGYYDNGEQVECQTYFCGDKIIQPGEQCDDGNLYPFDGCYKCKLSCNLYCDMCVNGWCYKCLKGYELSSDNSCQPICHDNIIAVPEQCDNNQSNCLNCQFKCTDYCNNCEFGICKQCNEQEGYYLQQDGSCQNECGDKIIAKSEQCDDGNLLIDDGCINCIQTCDSNCQICMKSKCQICKEGFIEIGGKCFSQCNNHIQTATEVCEDNNETPYDGCFFCEYSCSIFCIDCQFGKCFKCDEKKGWYLQKDGSCKPLCGDQQLAIYTEFCDDNNSYPYDGCHQCMLSCDEYCDICYQGLCTLCKKGYQLDFNTNSCYLKCDISYYLDVYENCNKLNKNCQQCKFKCKDPCTKCEQDLCLECNKPGWYYNSVNKNCEPKCGDGIIINGLEQCEDSLDKSCNECKYTCQEQCNFCVQGRCFSCMKGWILNIDQICTVVHGDNLANNLIEQCDDYNSLPYDGCYQGKFQCQSYCNICKRGICQLCNVGYYLQDGFCKEIHNDGLIVYQEQCDDNNLIAFDGCHYGKYDCPINCFLCIYGQCLKCNNLSGYGYLDDYQNKCKSICGDHIQTIDEECDDGNQDAHDGCYECKFQCDYDCILCDKGVCLSCKQGFYLNKKQNKCISYCGDGIVTRFEQCDDANKILSDGCADCKYQCNEKCLNCVEGKCYQCFNIGWELNLISNDCQPFCGDGLIVGNEQCDDQNEIQEDGCHECFYECQKVCTSCVHGYCEECNTLGWELVYNRCEPVCGDKLLVGLEECDDGNDIQEDGCYECKFQCQDQCTDCQKGVCMACDTKGWEIIDNICYAKCGDGFVVEGLEQCDDGNDTQYDGCFNCNYQCQELCTQCEQGICYECNVFGWIIENHVCLPFCGDGIVVGYEQCDDMNDDFNDGCHQCVKVCDQYCLDCQQGVCLECELGRFVDQNLCHAKCGDSFYVKSVEECDDGNQDNGDGCNFNCKVEKDWSCNNIEGSFSTCYFSIQPDFTLNLITKEPEDFEQVQLTFNQKIKLSQQVYNNLDLYFKSSIESIDTSEYEIIISYSEQLSQEEIKDLVIDIRINFFVPTTSPILKVEFIDNPIVSEYNLNLAKKENSLQLLTPLVLSQSQKEVAQSAQAFNQAVIYSLVGVSSLCILSGSSETFWNLMDQLQYLSYIKYINIKFPNNLNMYFDVFKLITISPAMKFFGIDKLFEALDGDTQYFLETKFKFKEDEINAYFFLNFQSFLFCLISAYSGFWIAQYGHKFLYKQGSFQLSKLPKFFVKPIISLRKTLKEKANQFYLNGILRILLSNTYDLTFACAIQIAVYPVENDFILKFNYIASIIIYIGQFGGTLYIINILNSFSKANCLKNKSKYEALFDGLNQSNNQWKIQHNAIQMIKKQIFISLIVFMQNHGQIQTLCLGFVQTIFLIYVILAKPLTNKFEYLKILVTEMLIIFNSITFLFYANRVELQLNLDDIINLGWLHIMTSTSILGVSLILDLYQQFKILVEKIRKSLFKPEVERNDSIVLFI